MTDEEIRKSIHYPECWDTMAYPTLASALWEMLPPLGKCKVCGRDQGWRHQMLKSIPTTKEDRERMRQTELNMKADEEM